MKQPGYEMEKLVLLTLMFAACYATPQDLSGKVFVFSRESTSDYAKLLTSKKNFSAVTVCLKFFTDLHRNTGLFSLATAAHDNGFVLFKLDGAIRVLARNDRTDFLSLSLPPNTWHRLCSTWGSDNGLAKLWVNGKPTIKRFVQSGQPIDGTPIIILGQEQDSYGGGFASSQSFVGMISDVHMWDYSLSDAAIKSYMNGFHVIPGNVLNWAALDYEVRGKAMVEEAPYM